MIKIHLSKTIFYIVLVIGVFNSVFRYYLVETSFVYFVYLPQFLMILFILLRLFFFLKKKTIKTINFLLILILFLSLIVGVVYTNTLFQVLMGLYILVPLIYGYLIYSICTDLFVSKKFYKTLLLAAIIGVLLNSFLIFPWEGFSYIVNGQKIEGNRFWTSLGTRRLSGFGRSSFETAAYILFLAILFLIKKFKFGIIWLLAGIAVYYTDTKGILLTFLIISVFIIFWKYIPIVLKNFFLVILLMINVILPISSWFFSVDNLSSYSFLNSFEDRLKRTWPDAYELIIGSGNFFTGRGLGGIGVPQNVFEPEKAHPGDNLFVYLLVIFGVGALLLYSILIFGIFKKKITDIKYDKLFYVLSIYVFVYGNTTNIIELPIMALCLGLVFRYWVENKKYEIIDEY